MRFNIRWLGFVPLFALVATLSWQATSSGGSAQSRYAVTILDNQAPSPLDGFDPYTRASRSHSTRPSYLRGTTHTSASFTRG